MKFLPGFRRPEAVCRLLLVPASCFVFTLLAWGPARSQDTYNVHFRSAEVTAQTGGLATLAIAIDNTPQAVTAFSFGVKHDAAKLDLQAVEMSSALTAVVGGSPDERFYNVEESPAGGSGFTVGIILSGDSSTATVLPAGLDHHVFNAVYSVKASAGESTAVQITGDLGSPKVPVVLDIAGVSQSPVGTGPVVTSASVKVTEGPVEFLRGDANQSGRLEVTDAILIVDYLFSGAQLPAGEETRSNCLVAMNVDGSTRIDVPGVEDARDIDLTDAIVLLQFIFPVTANPPPPAAPFPACGQPGNPVAPEISCSKFTCK